MCTPAIKAAVAFHSDILGAVILRWILPVFSFYMLYMSYCHLNKHKRWLAINNPNVISLTRYLVRPLNYQMILVVNLLSVIFSVSREVTNERCVQFLSISLEYMKCALLFVADPEWLGIVCLVVSLKCCGRCWHSTEVQSWCAGPTSQHHRPHHNLLVHYNLVRTKLLGI